MISTQIESTSWDTTIDCDFAEPIFLSDARFLHMAVEFVDSVRFAASLRFGEDPLYLRIDPQIRSPELDSAKNEWGIPAPELSEARRFNPITRDIRRDLERTWSNGAEKEVRTITGFQFRGRFRLLFLRIV